MPSKQTTVDFILEQLAGAGDVSARKMFGEFGLYRAGKLFALVCDDRLFLKPTPGGRAHLGDDVEEAAPYPGAKPHLHIRGETWDDGDRLSELATITATELPVPPVRRKAGAKRP